MLIDAHVHTWDLAGPVEYPWLTRDLASLYRTFRLADVSDDMDALGVAGMVLIQASDSLAETDALLAAARTAPHGRPARVVGWLPLADAAATARELERLQNTTQLVGVRHLIHNELDRQWMLRADVAAGMRVLEQEGLVFDAVAERPDLLEQVPIVARRHPQMTLVLDHLGKPPIAAADPEQSRCWSRLIRDCAAEPNVVAKISGLNTVSCPNWTAGDWRPYIDVALQEFGPQRLMVGGDWPFALQATAGSSRPYQAILGALVDVVGSYPSPDSAAILAGTARRVYHLPDL